VKNYLIIELDKKEIKEKYLDKIIYQYDLKNFVKDGFSKKINERILLKDGN
jgi:type III restriction enzyme